MHVFWLYAKTQKCSNPINIQIGRCSGCYTAQPPAKCISDTFMYILTTRSYGEDILWGVERASKSSADMIVTQGWF